MNTIVKPMPTEAEHAPLSVRNRSGSGIRTMIICSCDWVPTKAPDRGSTRSNAHKVHRRKHGLPPADYNKVVFGEGPWMGLTWDEWSAQHGGQDIDPYTGKTFHY